MKKIKYLFILFSAFIFNACIPEYNNNYEVKNLPSSFNTDNINDTNNISKIKWNEFFKDNNLIELINYALDNNTDLKSTLQKIEMAKNDLNFRSKQFYPKADLYSNFIYGKNSNDANYNTANVGILASWEIDLWGKLKNAEKASEQRLFATNEIRNLVFSNLIYEISNNYIELVSLDSELVVVRNNINILNVALETIKIQKSSNSANELGVKRFEAEVINYKSIEYDILQRIEILENKINFLLGRYSQKISRNPNILNMFDFKLSIGLPIELLKNRPDLKIAEYDLKAKELDIKVAETFFYPTLSLNANLGLQSALNDASNLPQSVAIGILGNLFNPILNRSTIEYNYKTSKSQQIEALINYQKILYSSYYEVNNQITQLKYLDKISETKKQELNTLLESINISDELFKAGRVTYFEMLLLQHTTFKTNIELIESKRNQVQAYINLYKALGGGWR